MAKIIVFNSVTLDGVMQAPGRPDEDRRGGFKHGGWSVPYADEETGKLAAEGMQTTGAMLLGRRTYEDTPSALEQGGRTVQRHAQQYAEARCVANPEGAPALA